MKTGIIRRIDDLGRIVIPKELRRSLLIKEGDPLEIMVENNHIRLEAYRPLRNMESISRTPIKRFYHQFGIPIALYDTTAAVRCEGIACTKDTLMHKELAFRVCDTKEYLFAEKNELLPMDADERFRAHTVIPIVSGVEHWGAVVFPVKGAETEASPEAMACARYIAGVIGDFLSNN